MIEAYTGDMKLGQMLAGAAAGGILGGGFAALLASEGKEKMREFMLREGDLEVTIRLRGDNVVFEAPSGSSAFSVDGTQITV